MIERASAGEMRAWLTGLDLGQYAEAFLANDIDLGVLPDLTDADLRELGVSLGHRKRLLREIEQMSDGGDDRTVTPAVQTQQRPPARMAERRRITVVFADLVGSTNLSVQYDPEDLSKIILAYQNCCQDVIKRWDGHILSYLGDGIVICLGYPLAHEDSIERAVHAALDIVEEVGHLRPMGPLKLQTRVGIATGEVVIGDLFGGHEGESAMAGETPNLAARLQDLAEPDGVVVSPSTKRLIGGLFDVESIGHHELKGFSEPIEVWQVKGSVKDVNRFDARRRGSQVPLIGRDEEMAKLEARWTEAKGGAGQVVLISGEAGIGKSHLCDALRQKIAGEPHTRLRYFCAPYHQNSVLFPIITQMERAGGIDANDDDATRLAKLERLLLSASDGPSESTALLAALLSIPTDERYPRLTMTTQRQRIETQDALVAETVKLAKKQPLLMIFEDAHWADPTTLELLGKLAQDMIRDLPILLLVASRPDFRPAWEARSWITDIKLDRIRVSDSQQLIAGIADTGGIPEQLVADIVAKADGVPLFVEELTKTVLEMKRADTEAGSSGSQPVLAVPETLHDSLMARLDRLRTAKPVAQLGAVIGRRFIYGVLAAVADLDDSALRNALDDLVKSEVVQCHGEAPISSYTFKHALIQDAAYSSLLHSRVRQLHGDIAGVLKGHFPDMADAEPEILAHHYARAEMHDKAVDSLMEAGIQATGRAAQIEAINHFQAAIDLVQEQPETAEWQQREIKLRALLGSALIAVKGYASDDVEETFRLAHKLCIKLDDSGMLCPVMYGLWVVNLARSDRQATTEMAAQLVDRFRSADDPIQRIGVAFANGITTFYRGDLGASLSWLDQVLTLYEPAQHDLLIQSYGDDLALFALAQLEWLETLRGDFSGARTREQKALDLAQDLQDPMSMTRTLVFAMMHRHDLRDLDGTEEMANRAIAFADEHVFPFWNALAQCGRGWAMAAKGEHAAGIDVIEQGLSFFALIDQKLPLTYWNSYLIEALLWAGEAERAATLIDTTLKLAETNVDSFFEAELRRFKGDLRLADGDNGIEAAEACYRQARDIAYQQGASLLERRAANCLARLLVDRGSAQEAKAILLETRDRSPISAEISDDRDTAVLLTRLS